MFTSIKNLFKFKSAKTAATPQYSSDQQADELPQFQESTHVQPPAGNSPLSQLVPLVPSRKTIVATSIGLAVIAGAYLLVNHPPLQTVNAGHAAVRTNQLTGKQLELSEGNALVIPGLHSLRLLNLRDQNFRAASMSKADGAAPVQSVEGLSLGVDVIVRYAIDPQKVSTVASRMQQDAGVELVEPALQGATYKTFARYTVREIFSTKRAEIQQALEAELKAKLAADGLLLRSVQVGKVDLPADYTRRMETLLAEELATEKMRYTLELKEKHVKEAELEANAEKVRRQLQAEAAGNEQIIAAKAQDEAMKHILPLKQRQIEQRKLEAEAQKQATIKTAEGSAEARRIEADGEAKARQRLAEAEAFRMQQVGKASAEQMAREGVLLSRHPLLIQKTMADKLSDKVQVIIAPPPVDGGFIGSALLGTNKKPTTSEQQDAATATSSSVDIAAAKEQQ